MDHVKLGALLDMGLAHAGLEVVGPVRDGAAIVGYEPITGAQLVATLWVRGLVTRLREPVTSHTGPTGAAGGATTLRLLRSDVAEDAR